MLIPFLVLYSYRNPLVSTTLKQGWVPVILSMFLSSLSGIVLRQAISDYKGIESFQPGNKYQF